jgi:hypothetical protein
VGGGWPTNCWTARRQSGQTTGRQPGPARERSSSPSWVSWPKKRTKLYWLEFLRSVGLGDPPTVERLLAEAKELRAIFATSHRTAKRNHRDQQQMERKARRSAK